MRSPNDRITDRIRYIERIADLEVAWKALQRLRRQSNLQPWAMRVARLEKKIWAQYCAMCNNLSCTCPGVD